MAQENEGGIRSFAAGEALEAHRRVKLSSGTVVYADAQDKSIGITVDAQATSGKQVAVKLHGFPGTRKLTAVAAITSGAAVYGAADGKVNDAWGSNGELLGTALEAADGDDSLLEVLPEKGGEELIFASVADSDAGGVSSAAEFTFSNGSVVIPADQVREGDIFRVRAKGQHTSTNGSDTFKGRLYFNTEKLVETPNPDAVNADVFMIDALVTVRAIGASGKLVASGYSMNDALAAGLATPFATAEVTEDLTTSVTIAIKGIWDASSASNSSKLEQLIVTRIRK